MKKTKPLPKFKSEAEERTFWEKGEGKDSTPYIDWSKGQHEVFPNLKPSTTSISLRLPDGMLARIKSMANGMDVPYQSLMKTWLAEKIAEKDHTHA